MQSIIKEYYENYCSTKLQDLEEIDIAVDTYNLPIEPR
jgi:hypothetical protein